MSESKPEIPNTAQVCGPQGECGCQCPDGPCGHKFEGPYVDAGRGAQSLACSKCGMLAIEHDIWVMP
jgi:hypothetical protein